MTPYIVVLTTFGTAPDAERAARTLVAERLAACATIVPRVRSVYRWKGSVRDEAEVLCILKTRRTLFSRLRARLVELHSYEVPEALALPVAAGWERYLAWLKAETRG
jgi:uncharacterized protein involved in tolerance to divalent cations